MAQKSRKNNPRRTKPAAETAKRGSGVKPDAKELNREITNALFTDEERLEMFFAKHWKTLVAAAIVVVLAITAAFAFVQHSRKAKLAATLKLAGANTVAELEAVLKDAPDGPGADTARFKLAKAYEEEKKYAQARAVLAHIATVSEDPAARSRAQLNTAYLFELEGDENKAAQQFSALSMQSVNPVAVRAEAACAAGRIYLKQGKKEAARKILKPAVALRPAPGQESAALWVRRAAELELTIN